MFKLHNLDVYGIPGEFKTRLWNDIQNISILQKEEKVVYKDIYDKVKHWADLVIQKETNLGLFFYGANGSGKTTLVCLIMKYFLINKVEVDRMIFGDLVVEYFEHWRVPEAAKRKAPLFIEEIGKEVKTNKDHAGFLLEDILKYRSEKGLVTSLSANVDVVDLTKRYGKTFESVVKGKLLPINFPSIDLRIRAADLERKKILQRR